MSGEMSPKERVRLRLHQIMERARKGDVQSKVFDIFMITLVVLNILAVVLETVQHIYAEYSGIFILLESISIALFSVEYIARLWACTADKKYAHPLKGRIKYALTPLAIIDLLAILPFYLSFAHSQDFLVLRILRLFRLLRILKIARYSSALQRLISIILKKKEELLLSMFLLIVVLLMASSLLYFTENGAQPEKFSSIPASMWWGIATMTTVGYGDIYPITPMGKFLAGSVALLGVAVIALPGAIVVSGYFEDYEKKKRCPHCRKRL